MSPDRTPIFFKKNRLKLAHSFYLFIYVLTDTKNFNFCVMKVRDFINFIRPISSLDPDSDLTIYFKEQELDLSNFYYDFDHVSLFLKSSE